MKGSHYTCPELTAAAHAGKLSRMLSTVGAVGTPAGLLTTT